MTATVIKIRWDVVLISRSAIILFYTADNVSWGGTLRFIFSQHLKIRITIS